MLAETLVAPESIAQMQFLARPTMAWVIPFSVQSVRSVHGTVLMTAQGFSSSIGHLPLNQVGVFLSM